MAAYAFYELKEEIWSFKCDVQENSESFYKKKWDTKKCLWAKLWSLVLADTFQSTAHSSDNSWKQESRAEPAA